MKNEVRDIHCTKCQGIMEHKEDKDHSAGYYCSLHDHFLSDEECRDEDGYIRNDILRREVINRKETIR